jgi:Heavy metal associated domain 2
VTGSEIKVVHAIPGRVRFKVAGLKANPSLGTVIQTRLKAVPGIRAVETTPLTGSVLVLFDSETLTAPASLLNLSETLTDLFPELDQTMVAEFLTQSAAAEPAGLSLSESLSDFLAGLSGRLAGIMGSLTDLRVLIPLTLVLFGLPRLLNN